MRELLVYRGVGEWERFCRKEGNGWGVFLGEGREKFEKEKIETEFL